MTESPRVLAALPCLMCHMHTSDLYVAEAHKHTHTHSQCTNPYYGTRGASGLTPCFVPFLLLPWLQGHDAP